MNFLKENAFLVGTAAAVIVGAVVVLMWGGSEGAKGDEAADIRTEYSKELVGLARRPVTDNLVKASDQRVKIMQGHRRKVTEDFLQRSSNYPVIEFAALYTGSGELARAFPIDPVLYDEMGGRLNLPRLYRKQVQALLGLLNPTTPPTDAEIEAARVRSGVPAGTPAGVPRTGIDLPPSGSDLPPDMRTGYVPPRRMERGPLAPGTEDKVRTRLVSARAAAGGVYADQNSMHQAIPAEMNYPDDELYMAQVALWVQQDIIAAIVETNRQFRRPATARKLNGVPASAVKRLVSLDVLGYVVMPKPGAVRVSSRGGGPYEASQLPSPPGQTTGETGKLSYIGFGQKTALPPQLTQRATNALYDVVHYEFTVVAVDRQLLPLYRNLLARNYHTILDVAIGQVGQPAAVGGRLEPVATASEGLFDYGPDPVVQARITGELLLLADFTRGRWNGDANDWDKAYPPLMPTEFLETLNDQDPSACRPEDGQRLKPAGAELGARKAGVR